MGVLATPLMQALAVVRIAVGLLFIIFGQYKAFGGSFVHGGIQHSLDQFVNQGHAVSFYKPFLANLVLPNATFFGYLVAWGELLIGISLVIGLYARGAALFGALHMLSLTLASWHAPGPDAAFWRYFAVQLDHLPLFFLFVLFFVGKAGHIWGLDGSMIWRPKQKGL